MKSNLQLMEAAVLVVELVALLIAFAFFVILFIVYLDIDQPVPSELDTIRWCDIKSVENALNLYQLEHSGDFPPGVDYELRMLGTAKTGCDVLCGPEQLTTQPECLDATQRLLPDYLKELPLDPAIGSKARTFYAIRRLGESGIYVTSCNLKTVEDLCVGQ